MAGNHRSGRPSIPITEHELRGTKRSDRHDGRDQSADGEPVCPTGFDEHEQWCWDFVVMDLVRRSIAKRVDTLALTQLCEMWGLYRKSLTLAKAHPVDKEIRCATVAYRSAFDSIGARFGLTTSDRQRLHGTGGKKKQGVAKRKTGT